MAFLPVSSGVCLPIKTAKHHNILTGNDARTGIDVTQHDNAVLRLQDLTVL